MPVDQITTRWVVQEDGSRVRSTVPPKVTPEDGSYPTPRTHSEADEQAAERGISFPDEEMTVKEKQDYLASQG